MRDSWCLAIAATLGGWLCGCGGSGDSGMPDGPAPDAAPGCAQPTGSGTEHSGTIGADETWTAEDSPHVVTFDLYVQAGTLTIEPCAVVRVRKGYHLSIGGTPGQPDAAIVAHGESIANEGADPTVRPVVFERDVDTDPWGSLYAGATGRIDLEHVILTGGADPDTAPSLGGTLIALGAGGNTGLTRNLRTVDVTIDGSGGFGVNLQNRAGFSEDSSGLVIRNSGFLPSGSAFDSSYPVLVDGPALSTIPEGTYAGNAKDEIFVFNASSLLDPEVTIRDRGIPYHFESNLGMSPLLTDAEGGLSTLTIEPGVVLRFANGGPSASRSIDLGTSNGNLPENIWPVRLIAQGTADAPIVFTSAEASPAAGDWTGLEWHGGPATGNVMSYVHVEYAGADSGNSGFSCGLVDDGAVIFTNWRPDDAFITHSTFSDSAAGGIVCGWMSDLDGPDLVGDNAFVRIANGCNVARWSDTTGCPGTPPLCL